MGSIFLYNFVKNPFTNDAFFDSDLFYDTVKIAVRMLDNIIDVNVFPNKIYENYQKNMRTIGLGVTGFADCLAMLGLRYGSQEAIDFTNSLFENFKNYSYQCSSLLANEKGNFPFYDESKHLFTKFIENCNEQTKNFIRLYGLRNAKINAVAPVGTLSIVYGNNCSSGIEPIFSLSYERKVKIGGQEDENISVVKMEDYAYALYNEMVKNNEPVDYKPEEIFPTAMDLTVDEHINMLEAISKHIDMSVSKTINIPTDYSFEDTKEVYMECWKKGIKGCTIFRPNEIRQGILIDETHKKETKETPSHTLQRGDIIQCSKDLIGKKRKIISGCGSLHILAYFDPDTGDMMEVYLNMGSQGGCLSNTNAISRLLSLLCRAGVDVNTIKDQLDSVVACPAYVSRTATKHDTSKGKSCPSAIGFALIDMWNEMQNDLGLTEEEKKNKPITTVKTQFKVEPAIEQHEGNKCPECGEPLVAYGGCWTCPNCFYSRCE